MANIIHWDTETTGLNNKVHGIISLSYLIDIDGKVVHRGKLTMNPLSYDRPVNKVSPKALEVNGYKESHLTDFPDAKAQCANFISVLNKYIDRFDTKSYFIPAGFNVQFDNGFIQEWFKVCGYDSYGQYFTYKSLCCFEAIKWLQYLGKINTGPSQNLSSCCKAIGLNITAHDSSVDIESTRDLFYKIKELI
ncbi:MAG: exonuclease domain-containing protein [Sulfurimonas sp.]|uniref:3'-5' exonuclease n=1 Tax=Sulfurimonas sp. TaxID=2022749 RepID=UPI003D0CC3A8